MQTKITLIWYKLAWAFALGLCVWVIVGCSKPPQPEPISIPYELYTNELFFKWVSNPNNPLSTQYFTIEIARKKVEGVLWSPTWPSDLKLSANQPEQIK